MSREEWQAGYDAGWKAARVWPPRSHEARRNVVLIDFGDGVERECALVRLGPDGSWLIRSPEGAEGYYSGPFTPAHQAAHKVR